MKFKIQLAFLLLSLLIINTISIQRVEKEKNEKKKWPSISGFVSGIKNAASSVASGISNAASSVANAVAHPIDTMKQVESAVSNAASKVVEATGDLGKKAINAAKAVAEKVVDKGKDLVNKAVNKVDEKLNQGGGSWTEGFDCPKILIGSHESNLKEEGRGTFFPDQIGKPVTVAEKLGWAFDMKKKPPGPILQKVFVQLEKTNIWYIPYSWMVANWSYTNPVGFKYLQTTILNGKKEEFLLRIDLPYKGVGWFIDDNQANKIIGMLNKRREEMKITSPKWKVVLSWTAKECDLDLKIPIRLKGETTIKSYKEGPTEIDLVKWGTKDSVTGNTLQTGEIDSTTLEPTDSIQFYVANYSFYKKSIMESGATVTIFNGDRKVSSIQIPQTGDKMFPYWYVGVMYKYGLIVENILPKPQAKPVAKPKLRKVKKMKK